MTLVNFYNKTPEGSRIASDLGEDELVVFNHQTSGAEILADEVRALVDFGLHLHNENTIPRWEADDYFVMVRSGFGYGVKREQLRALALEWFRQDCPNQVKHI